MVSHDFDQTTSSNRQYFKKLQKDLQGVVFDADVFQGNFSVQKTIQVQKQAAMPSLGGEHELLRCPLLGYDDPKSQGTRRVS